MPNEELPKKLEEVAAKALDSTASDFSNYTPPSGKLRTGEALAGVANIGANKLYSAAEVLDNLTSRRVLIAGWSYIENFIMPKVQKKVEAIPAESRQMPPLLIVGPVLEAAKYTAEEPILSEMFATLLAASMDASMSGSIHPSFSEIIKQLTPEEARILKYLENGDKTEPVVHLHSHEKGSTRHRVIVPNFSLLGLRAGNELTSRIQRQVISLSRLGLTLMPEGTFIPDEDVYKPLEEHEALKEFIQNIKANNREPRFRRTLISLTSIGRDFCDACVKKSDFPNDGTVEIVMPLSQEPD